MVESNGYLMRIAEEFWQHVEKGEENACWEWTGPIHRQGHGTFPVPGVWSSPPAHRLAYHLTYGVPPVGQVVWRTCGNRLCVNPNHLQAGGRGDFRRSIQERAARG
jgi:hypothetical protein